VDKTVLIKHRMDRAEETLSEARTSFENESFLLAANRVYYSAFYAVSALAIKNNFSTSKHGQLLGWFNQYYIKTGMIEKPLGKFYLDAFELRQESDYEDFFKIDKTSIEEKIKTASEFIDRISAILNP
ncbi:MAG: HEPN domain-containing protein, partial [Ignavibacteria bacterium]|nr:HEPN domain-containing protein [Ignavibacteria bacterium]